MGGIFKAVKSVVGGVVDAVGSVLGVDDDPPKVSMPSAPSVLKDDSASAAAADKAASESAAKKAEEERRKRAMFGRKGTFAGAQTGLVGPAPTLKKKLLGQ